MSVGGRGGPKTEEADEADESDRASPPRVTLHFHHRLPSIPKEVKGVCQDSTQSLFQFSVYRGEHAVYGRNTLGGAVVMQTKRGQTNPGTTAEMWGGSFGRIRSLLQTGGVRVSF